jgi:catechol 2,3-dioxygenase-like lactoylglutathione lyase family enzyme
MAKVLGRGGVFFQTSNVEALRDWYRSVLGLEFADWGGVTFEPVDL